MKNIFIFICFLGSIGYAKAACNTVESTAQSGGYLVLRVGKIMLEDVTTFKEIDDKVFYSISPIYGKPEIGVIDCINQTRSQLVTPQNLNKAYPDGADFFKIKVVSKEKNNTYVIKYFHILDVDSNDFKNLEKNKNLKSHVYSAYIQKSLCENGQAGLACLTNNFSQMYANSYEETFKILNSSKAYVVKCEDKKVVSDFFKLNVAIKGNTEVEGFYSEVLEKFFLSQGQCFMTSLDQEKTNIQIGILSKLKKPMFKDKKSIDAKMFELSKDIKNQKIIELYKKQ